MGFVRDCDGGSGPSICNSVSHKCELGFHHVKNTDTVNTATKQNGNKKYREDGVKKRGKGSECESWHGAAVY
jgi:hypothetical protein